MGGAAQSGERVGVMVMCGRQTDARVGNVVTGTPIVAHMHNVHVQVVALGLHRQGHCFNLNVSSLLQRVYDLTDGV